MKILYFFLTFSFSLNLFAQVNLKVYYEETDNGFQVLADNGEYCPVSIDIQFKLTNLKSTEDKDKIFVVPAQTKGHILTNLEIVNPRKGYKFNFGTRYNYGDHTQTEYDTEFGYYLPFKKGEAFPIFQGYNGRFSHLNENALDFTMPVGTEIYAARGGIVTNIVEKNNKNCAKPSCAEFNNYITIYHEDGTFAEYTHIKKNGAKVKVGDKVEIGQHIGYSGNVGYSSGPHLHFIVYLMRLQDRETLETKFLVGDGSIGELLQEKNTYQRDY